ncbi:MAG: glycerophosphodiester phosphodiesterase family protein [Nocardioidaceae bacterium]
MAMVSAHEYGARLGSAGGRLSQQFTDGLTLGADFVEFDVRRTADGVFVVRHDREIVVGGEQRRIDTVTLDELHADGQDVLTYTDALAALRGRASAHIDLKLSAPARTYDGPDEQTWEVQATALAVAALGAEHIVVTTGKDRAVAALVRWSATACPQLLVGLSLGGSRSGWSLRRQVAGRWSELFPARRVAATGANVLAANRWLARFGVARWAHRHELRLLVWTVDDKRGLRRWLRDPRCWLVTTNNVRAAVRLRDGYRD